MKLNLDNIASVAKVLAKEGASVAKDLAIKGASAAKDLAVAEAPVAKDLAVKGASAAKDLAVEGAVYTAKKAKKGIDNVQEARDKKREAEEIYKTTKEEYQKQEYLFNVIKDKIDKKTVDLNELIINIVEYDFKSIKDLCELANKNAEKQSVINKIVVKSLDEDKTVLNAQLKTNRGTAEGVMLGGASAASAFLGVSAFGTTAAGTAISSLSGAASLPATLSALGGGSLAAGGFGMLGGACTLAGLFALPAASFIGYKYVDNAEKNYESAMKLKEEGGQIIFELKQQIDKLSKIERNLSNIHTELLDSRSFPSKIVNIYNSNLNNKAVKNNISLLAEEYENLTIRLLNIPITTNDNKDVYPYFEDDFNIIKNNMRILKEKLIKLGLDSEFAALEQENIRLQSCLENNDKALKEALQQKERLEEELSQLPMKNNKNELEEFKKIKKQLEKIKTRISEYDNEKEKLTDKLKKSEQNIAKIEKEKKALEGENAELQQRNAELEEERIRLQKEIEYLEKNATKATPLHNEEITEKFNEFSYKAKKELDIISPWMSKGVVNDSFIDRLRRLLEKGVTVKILYGIGTIKSNEKKDKRNQETENIAEELQKEFKKYKNFHIKRTNTHEKLVICDDNYFIISSYNYLSFSGKGYNEKNSKTRNEMGLLVEDIKILNKYRKDYFNF